MKVNSSNTSNTPRTGSTSSGIEGVAANPTTRTRGRTGASSLEATRDRNHTEKVELSQKIADMNKIKELASAKGEVNSEKVAHLQKLIDDGNYKTDSHAIAERLLDEHLKMPS